MIRVYRLLLLISFIALLLNAGAQSHQNCSHSHSGLMISSMQADNSRSDTFDLKSIHLDLDFTNFSEQTLHASAQIEFESLMSNVNWINLDLLGFTVDSVLVAGESTNFEYESPLLGVSLGQELNAGDLLEVEVFYHGQPQQDASGWGGFYWTNNYAFNLGVGFAADPHNYGRAWFPCFDNFVERSTFTFSILTDQGKTAVCNGEKISTESVGQDSTLTTWSMQEEIPSYLTSIAVGNYSEINQILTDGFGNEIPTLLAAPESNTTSVTNSFVNLEANLQSFTNSYGPFMWNRIGFVFVPFTGGAMEHATNIAYPISFADGSLSYETLMAHEFAHNWWGNLVTCRTAEDMWINEGMASFSEAIFLEDLYGEEEYTEFIKSNHKNVLLYAHTDDGGEHRAISGVPHEFTYGSHVYNKGADVANALRVYMGDEDFFTATAAFMDEYAFSDVSSEDMRDYYDSFTDADISEFFDRWVFAPGYPEFSIDSTVVTDQGSNWEVELFIPQRLHFAPNIYNGVPLQVTVMDSDRNTEHFDIITTGEYTTASIVSSIEPVRIFLNFNHKISQAVLAENKHIGDTGLDNFSDAEFQTSISEIDAGDSLWIRAENHFVGADPEQSQVEFHISTDRYWRVDGFFPESLEASAKIEYHGDPSSNKFLDPTFFETLFQNGMTEDSLVVVHRVNPSEPWQEVEGFTIQTAGSSTDAFGWLNFENLKRGDYVWAFRTGLTGISNDQKQSEVRLFPNPTSDVVNIRCGDQFSKLKVIDLSGKGVISLTEIPDGSKTFSLHIGDLPAGLYIVRGLDQQGSQIFARQLVKK
jgi:aminopeptidase N